VHPTLLVHEVYLRFAADGRRWESKTHIVAVAARAMRQILADRARKRMAGKRGAGAEHLTLSGVATERDPVDLILADRALRALEQASPRRAEVFVLRALGGLTVPEAAQVLKCSERTVKSDWRFAKAWLASRLSAQGQGLGSDDST